MTHCGMNSVNESLYYGVPMVLYPQHSEQNMVADRVATLKAGVILKRDNPEGIKDAVIKIMNDVGYKDNADVISESFKKAGGVNEAVDRIIDIATNKSN
ncbi:nucleotide disphospho-sugar-binding domain-containing protein [Romboutsia sp.]|uniref:nucleotide disphospho-sugar-binding domain-containing protein n=1 Tax=Romboutsia sp. TaxID=1965302 RepID=UPI003F2C63B6